jgi:hypothetical protein
MVASARSASPPIVAILINTHLLLVLDYSRADCSRRNLDHA